MIIPLETLAQHTGTTYPEPFRAMVAGRSRRRVGEAAGLTRFGVNMTTLAPGSCSALRHWHSQQDEFVYVVAGTLTLITDAGEQDMTPGMMAGFAAGAPNGHQLVNRSDQPATYLEVGDRTPNDQATYPDLDLLALPMAAGQAGHRFVHRDGQPY
ncbi:MAG: cupin domain-containing protein [Cyanobacteria bacterium P01_A01_bin.105]